MMMTNKTRKKYPKEFHDQIAKLVCNHFNNNLPKTGKPLPSEWTTFAAIVQSTDSKLTSLNHQKNPADNYNLSVVSCATGTRCLGKANLSELGDVIHDSHAEVLTRRCFLLFLYDQLKLCQSSYSSGSSSNSIFSLKKNNSNNDDSISASKNSPSSLLPPQQHHEYILMEGIEFHLFVSQLPCGDAAIIIDNTEEEEEEDNNIIGENCEDEPKSKKPKIEILSSSQHHRTGAKLQPGPLIYEKVQSVGKCRVKGGKGDPTLSMSCSDKIAKWQILGLQGCLLSNFIPNPIRLSSITIGAFVPFNEDSLSRAIYQRFDDIFNEIEEDSSSSCKKLFLKHYFVPSFAQAEDNFSNYFDPVRKNPCPSSIIYWHRHRSSYVDLIDTAAAVDVQVIVNGRKQGAIKKNFGKPSTMVDICRKNILQLFYDMYLYNIDSDDTIKSKSYLEAKQLNQCYVKCWSFLRSKVMIGWTDKPDNIQNFSL